MFLQKMKKNKTLVRVLSPLKKYLENKRREKLYYQFTDECMWMFCPSATLETICRDISNITGDPIYSLEFYREYQFWDKIFDHEAFQDFDIEQFQQALESVRFPELLPGAWEVMIKRIIEKKGVFHLEHHTQDWLALLEKEEERTEQRFQDVRAVLERIYNFPTGYLSGCLNFDIQDPVFADFFDMDTFVPLINTQILTGFSPRRYLLLENKDKILYREAFLTLDRNVQMRMIRENKNVLLYEGTIDILMFVENLSIFDKLALSELRIDDMDCTKEVDRATLPLQKLLCSICPTN